MEDYTTYPKGYKTSQKNTLRLWGSLMTLSISIMDKYLSLQMIMP